MNLRHTEILDHVERRNLTCILVHGSVEVKINIVVILNRQDFNHAILVGTVEKLEGTSWSAKPNVDTSSSLFKKIPNGKLITVVF